MSTACKSHAQAVPVCTHLLVEVFVCHLVNLVQGDRLPPVKQLHLVVNMYANVVRLDVTVDDALQEHTQIVGSWKYIMIVVGVAAGCMRNVHTNNAGKRI